jgi:ABC-2 type transport system permease protein
MTRSALTIAWHEYLVNVRRPGFISVTLLIPALGLIGSLVAVYVLSQSAPQLSASITIERQPLGVVDQSGLYGRIPDRFADALVAYPDEAAARRALLASEIGAYVFIPAGYAQGTAEITSYVRSEGGLQNAFALEQGELPDFLIEGLLAGQAAPEVIARVTDLGDWADNPRPINPDGSLAAEQSQSEFGMQFALNIGISLVFSILMFISIFTSAQYLLRSVSEEKENRVMEIVLSSVSPVDLLFGKVIGLGALGLTQVGVWILSGVLLTGGLSALAALAVAAISPLVVFMGLVYFLLGFVLFGTLMAVAGSMGTNMRESQQIAGIFSFAAVIPWMLNSLVIFDPNNTLLRVLSWIPLTAPVMMLLRLPSGQVPVIDIVASVVLLVATIPLVLWAGAKIFRTSLLMYGKRLSFREVFATLRSS